MEKDIKEHVSNYDIFKIDALKRFLTYDQQEVIDRLNLKYDDHYIYIDFCSRKYRIGRVEPVMEEYKEEWNESNANAVLTICDLLCHTKDPIILSGTFKTVSSLNRVKGGSSTILGSGIQEVYGKIFDGHAEELASACRSLHGEPMGKGDVAYCIPLFGPIKIQISFYESDDEFPAQFTVLYDEYICNYLFYETIWYLANLVIDRLKEYMK